MDCKDTAQPATVCAAPLGLLPKLGLLTTIMIVMGNIIGSGIFKKSSGMAADLQSPGLLLICWFIGGVISLLGALTNAEIAGIIADPGGQYAFFKKMYGRVFAYVYGWAGFVVILSASTASIAYVCGESANALFSFPRLSPEWEAVSLLGIHPLDNLGVKLFTIAIITFISVTNYFGVIFGGMLANISMALKLTGIAIVAILGLTWNQGTFHHLTPVLTAPGAQYTGSLGLFGAMFSALLGAFWAYDAWINVTFLGGEVRNAKRNIPLALGFGVLGVVVVYMIVNVAYLHVMDVAEMGALAKVKNSIIGVEVLRKAYGDQAALFVAVLVMLSTFGATNCSLLPSSRMYYAMARDGLFFKAAANVHPKHRTPSTSLLMQCLWICALVMSGTFDTLSDLVIFASFIFYGLGAFGIFVLRRTMPDAERPYRMHGYPVLPMIFVVFCFVLVVVTVVQQPQKAAVGLGLILAGLPIYFCWKREPIA